MFPLVNIYDSLPWYTVAGLLFVVVAHACWKLWSEEAFYPGFEVYGVPKNNFSLSAAKQEYLKNGREIMLGGAKKIGGCFQAVTANGPRIIFPNRYADELRSIRSLSLSEIFRKELFADYPGFDPIRLVTNTDVIPTTVRTKLTAFLVPVSFALREESNYSIDTLFKNEEEWTSFDIHAHAAGLVTRLSTRAFLGPVLCRDPAWLKIAADWAMILMDAARALRMWPGFLKPVVHWVLPECRLLRRTRNNATKIIQEELARRQQEKLDPDAPSFKKVGDTLGWMQDVAGTKDVDLSGGQLVLTFASIHTTTDLLTKCIYTLTTHREYQPLLRKEIVSVLSETGWDKTALHKMKLLDSFMKETQRLMPTSVRLMNRVAMKEVTLKDGTTIPKRAIISIIQDRLFDPEVYPEPEKFDGHRFLKLRSHQGQESQWQLVTTSVDHTGFGHGIHSCPGRFFAATELKVALCFLLLRYDWKLDCPEDTPMTIQHGSEIFANPGYKIAFRRRKEELDIMALALRHEDESGYKTAQSE